ncbi:MAG TPA: hypothetical protein PLO37_18235 [Candidatus Hydrogenedentes bacterium]|nr:hypothetical protein [Candidatus Hydrogenedentota bacterium]HPG68790.1 hypothetical protein [Candidatus Hydrogenedentota bacterium]
MKVAVAVIAVVLVLSLIFLGLFVTTLKRGQLTEEKYAALEVGMRYEEVVAILGGDGEPTDALDHYVLASSADSLAAFREGYHYVWRNPNGSGVMLTFDDEKRLTSKNIPRLDTPGILGLRFDVNSAGEVLNRDEIERVLGDEAEDYLALYLTARHEDLGDAGRAGPVE